MKKTILILLLLLFILPQSALCMSAEDFVVSDQVDDHDKYYFYARMLISDMSLEEKVSQLFLIDHDAICENTESFKLTEDAKEQFKSLPPSGVMIRGKHIHDEQQLRVLTDELQFCAKTKRNIPLFIAAEEEGGYVERIALKLGYPGSSTMAEIGKAGYEEDAYLHGEMLGKRLNALGINMNFAPYAVTSENKETDVVPGRYLSSDPEVVSTLSRQIVGGMQQEGVLAVMKRFPGESMDSEYITESASYIKKYAALPYIDAKENGLGFILVSNQSIPEITGLTPACLSYEVCSQWLRNEIRFEGVVISDVLTDKTVTSQYGHGAAAVQAIQSGCDLLVIDSNYQQIVQDVMDAIKRDELTEERINQSLIRIIAGKIISGMIE